MLRYGYKAVFAVCLFGISLAHPSKASIQTPLSVQAFRRRPVVQRVLQSEQPSNDVQQAKGPRVVRRVSMNVDQLGTAFRDDRDAAGQNPPRKILSSRRVTGHGEVPNLTKMMRSRASPARSVLKAPRIASSGNESLTAVASQGSFDVAGFIRFVLISIFLILFCLVAMKFLVTYHGPVDIRNLVGRMRSERGDGTVSRMSTARRSMKSATSMSLSMNDWRAKQKQDIHAAGMQKASMEFAARTKLRWRVNKQMVDGRTEILINALANQTVEEYFHYNDVDTIDDHLKTYGLRLNSDLLKKEIKRGDCQLLRIPAEKWIAVPASVIHRRTSNSDYQLVRCVRIVRVIVQARTTDGFRTLIEDHQGGTQDNLDHYPTAKVGINAGDAENAWPSVLHSKLGLPDPWLRQFVTMASFAETVAEVQTSNKFPGLPTWYLVDEVTVNVSEAADKQELKLLGLPQGENFRGTGKHRHRTWLWADVKEGSPMHQSFPIKDTPPGTRASSVSGTPRVQKCEGGDMARSSAQSSSNSAGDSTTTDAAPAVTRIRGRSASKLKQKDQPQENSTPTMTDLPSEESKTPAEDSDMDKQTSALINPRRSKLARGRSAVMQSAVMASASTHDGDGEQQQPSSEKGGGSSRSRRVGRASTSES
jgi:hypothetical protein